MAFDLSQTLAGFQNDNSIPTNSWSGPSALTNPAAYGSVPGTVSPASTSAAATGAAIGAGQQVNAQLPGYNQSLASVGSNIQADTSGQVPADVIEQLQTQGAEENAETGAGSNAAYLKSLGLTSLGLEQTGQTDLQNILTSLPGADISQNPAFQPTTGQQLDAGQQNSVWGSAPNPAAAAAASLAATGAGYGVGSSSATPTGLRATTAQPYTPPTTTGYVSPWSTTTTGVDTGNAPGSPGALSAWNAWNGQPVYPASSTTGTGTTTMIYPGQTTVTDPTSVYYGSTPQEIEDAQTPAVGPGDDDYYDDDEED